MTRESGTVVVEFALVTPIVLLLVLGIVEIAAVARTEIQLTHAAREGARQAATSPDTARAASAVRAALGPIGARAKVSVSRPSAVGEPATVSVALRHRVVAPLLGGLPVDLRASATMRTER